MKGEKVDHVIQMICPFVISGKIYDINKEIIERVKKLHDKWVRNGNVSALIEANYLIDYYCSHIVNYCDSNVRYNASHVIPAEVKVHRSIKWHQLQDTHDVFYEVLSYSTGFQRAKAFVFELRKQFLKKLAGLSPDQVIPYMESGYVNIPLDWKTMLARYPLVEFTKLADEVVYEFTKYNAASWGMYRLVNLNDSGASGASRGKRPASCIVNSLLILTLFYLTGFPQHYLSAYFQVPEPSTKKFKKYTHWASTCTDPFFTLSKESMGVIPGYHERETRPFWSSEAFASYTRDIIRYYEIAAQSFKYDAATKVTAQKRIDVLTDLRKCYDDQFIRIRKKIRTPSSSSSKTSP